MHSLHSSFHPGQGWATWGIPGSTQKISVFYAQSAFLYSRFSVEKKCRDLVTVPEKFNKNRVIFFFFKSQFQCKIPPQLQSLFRFHKENMLFMAIISPVAPFVTLLLFYISMKGIKHSGIFVCFYWISKGLLAFFLSANLWLFLLMTLFLIIPQ